MSSRSELTMCGWPLTEWLKVKRAMDELDMSPSELVAYLRRLEKTLKVEQKTA